MSLSKWVLSSLAALLAYGILKFVIFIVRQRFSCLRHLPGPKSPSLFYGNFGELFSTETTIIYEKWAEKYGPTLSYKGLFSIHRLYTTDLKAINYMLTHSDEFRKPSSIRYSLSRILGAGIIVVEGERHRHQRRIMNPAFGRPQIRELTGVFTAKANQLRDVWSAQLTKQAEPTRVDVLEWLSRFTLDVIGLAGFHYNFDTLNPDSGPNELKEAFSTLFRTDEGFKVFPFLQSNFPLFRLITTQHDCQINKAKAKMDHIARQLLRESKRSVALDNPKGDDNYSLQGRDLLSLLTRANMTTDLPENQRLSDEDVLSQVGTFMVAGHETTRHTFFHHIIRKDLTEPYSVAATWALYSLAIRPDVQTKLREEIFTLSSENPSMDELESLQYLDYVVREVLRLHAPVASTFRFATKDNILPLDTPFVDTKGKTHECIRVRKGDPVLIPIVAINRSTALWGEDAAEFRPERWEAVPQAVNNIPGLWSNLLTFLNGPRACIGFRFAIVETKAILFSLIKAFHFKLAVPAENIVKRSMIIQRPVVIGEEGNQMPMFITPYQHS